MATAIEDEVRGALTKLKSDADAFYAARKEKEGELQARLLELEQKGARRGGDLGSGTPFDDGSLRNLLEGSTELKLVAERKSRRAVIELPAGFFATKTIVSGNGLALPERRPDIVPLASRRLTIRALIPSVPTTAGAVQYVRETAFTNNAAIVSETTQKPESDITFELKTSAIATVAHWVKCSVQVLSDTPQLMQYIDFRLRYGVAFAEELQLLKGSGVGNNLEGLMTVATAYNRTTGGDTKADVLRRAITQLEDTNFEATGIVLHPFDWEAISLIKTTQGEYVVGAPSGANPPTLWNLPVIPTSSMTAGSFLVADFPQSALVFDREQSRVDISTEDDTNFQKNLVTVRGEERIGLAILRAGGLIKGTF